MTGIDIRHQIAERLSGDGVEFGAGASPFPVPSRCRIRYADRNTPKELADRKYFEGSVRFDLQMDLTDMSSLEDGSLDFIIASHVIEHTPNPILAILNAHRKLRDGGRFVLVVPDKVVTFDKGRPLTGIDHLLADFLLPSHERDFEHYLEFFRLCFPQAEYVRSARDVWARGDDIHFHTWTYESFQEMIDFVAREHACPWRGVWSHPRLSDLDIEFYYVLTK
jgi:SAM-dependent methyltransferase